MRYQTMLVRFVQAVLALMVMVDWATFSVPDFIVPLNLQYAVIILFHRRILNWFGVNLTDAQSLMIAVGMTIHPLGMIYGFYAQLWFWDYLTHFYSGALVAAVILVVLWRNSLSARKTIVYSFMLTFFAGLVWEGFELFISTRLIVHGTGDTIIDMMINMVGWLTIIVLGKEPFSNMLAPINGRRDLNRHSRPQ